jgi:hypothetical protein
MRSKTDTYDNVQDMFGLVHGWQLLTSNSGAAYCTSADR